MLSALYYLLLVLLCTLFMILSALALVVCYPFDRGRRTVHELSRILVRIFFFLPPFWRQRVIGRGLIDRKKRYVIVINHNTVIDIPALYYIPLNFRWVSKREVFKTPFFGQFLLLHGDICIDRGHAAEALEQMVRDGRMWISRGASVAVFPEGTRSKNGEIGRFKAGAFTLAKEAGVDILPVVMDGTKTLVEGTDYTVSYGTNVHVFEAATVYVEGKGNYTGTFSRNFKIQPKPIDIEDVKTTDRDYEEGRLDVDCTVKLPVASDVKQGTHYHVFATMADDTAGTGKTVNVLVKMEKGGLGENYTLNKDTTTAIVNINQINPADPTGLKGVKGNALSTVELPAGWNWDAPATVMNTAGPQTFKAHYAGDANHIAVSARPITVYVLDKTDVSTFITFPDGEKEYTGSWMKYEEASISGTNLGTGAKWNYIYTAGTGTLMAAGFPEGIGTYTVTATYEDSINFGIATATLTIVPKKVAIPAADTTVFTYDGSAKTYGISDTADYTVTGNSQTNAGDHTVTVALRDKATTAWADGTTADKTYTFTIKQATPTGEPAYTKITTSGKTLADAGLTVTGSTLNPNAGTLEWVDDAGNVLPDTTTVAANTTYKWRFTPTNTNYTTLTGSIKLYHKSSSSGGSSHSSRYTITVDSVKHGTITVSPKSAYKGDTVTITVKPDKGYELDTLKVLDKDGDKVKITEKKGKYTFTMPASKVTIKGKFVEEAPEQIFADVPVDAYCYEAVKYRQQPVCPRPSLHPRPDRHLPVARGRFSRPQEHEQLRGCPR